MKELKFLVVLVVFAFVACEKTPELVVDSSNLIVGTWIDETYSDSVITMKRANALSDDLPGIQFNADGTLTKRMNAGFCGTPPISYANYSGTWLKVNDSVINVHHEFWGGTDNYQMKIVSVTNLEMRYLFLYE